MSDTESTPAVIDENQQIKEEKIAMEDSEDEEEEDEDAVVDEDEGDIFSTEGDGASKNIDKDEDFVEDDDDEDDEGEEEEEEEEEDDDEEENFEPSFEAKKRVSTRATRSTRREIMSEIPEDCLDFAIRRSSRVRKNTTKYQEQFSEEEDDDEMDDGEDEDDENGGSSDDYEEKRAPKVKREKKITRTRRSQKRWDWEEPRRSSRNTTRIAYNEPEEDSDEEEYEKEQARKKAAKLNTQEDNQEDTIEKVLNHKLVKTTDENGDEVYVQQYEVKWKGWSHIHNTWCTLDYLKDFNGFKKVQNYEKQRKEEEYWRQTAQPEDVEHLLVQKEMEQDLHNNWLKVERVIAVRHTAIEDETQNEDGSTTTEEKVGDEYFVKWQDLTYDKCTWETASDIQDFQNEIDAFLSREQQHQFAKRNTDYKRNRPAPIELKKQPSWLDHAGELRDYQLQGLNWLIRSWCSNINGILADEMGLGKTVQSIAFLSWLQYAMHIPGPFLVVVPLSTLDNWMKECKKWVPEMNVVAYIGNSLSRSTIREFEFYSKGRGANKRFKVNVLMTTYEIVGKDQALLKSIHWVYLIVDEAHRLKNSDSILHKTLAEFKTDNRLLVTGTPLQNSIRELWSLLHFLQPKKFPSLSDFEGEYASLEKEEQIAKLHAQLAPHMIRRIKKEVEKSLPSKTERILRVEMSPMQKLYYKLIINRNYNELNKSLQGKGRKASLINIVVELRKCCNHPYLFEGAEEFKSDKAEAHQLLIRNSGKLLLLHKLLVRLKEKGHRVLIFSQMVRMLDILADYLKSQGFLFQRLDGSMSRDLRQQSMEHFNAEGSSDFCFLLSTRAGGLGINLATADTVIIYDSDWNPQNDLQAVARAHRIGQKNVVNIYRLVTKETVEEKILESAKQKMVLDHLVIQRMETGKSVFTKDDLNSILKFGAKSLFTENSEEKGEEGKELDLDEILARAEHCADEENESAADQLLNSFKVANLKTDDDTNFWAELISNPIDTKEEEVVVLPPRRSRALVRSYDDPLHDPSHLPLGDLSDASLGKRKRAAHSSAANKKKKTQTSANSQLNDKEIRALIKSLKKFGCSSKITEIAEDAHLSHKKQTIVQNSIKELLIECEKYQENEEKGGKKNDKAASVDFHGVTFNPIDLYQRVKDLTLLNEKISSLANPKNFRISVPTRPASFPCSWGVKDDSMLMLGVHKYGYGSWDKIRDDPDLLLSRKIAENSADDSKVKTVQLSRRVDLLFKALRSEPTKERKTAKASKEAPQPTRQSPRKLPPKKKTTKSMQTSDGDGGDSKEEKDIDPALLVQCEEMLAPLSSILEKLRLLGEGDLKISNNDRIRKTKKYLLNIGKEIDKLLLKKKDQKNLEFHMWHFVRTTAKASSTSQSLMLLYKKIRNLEIEQEKEKAKSNNNNNGKANDKKPRGKKK